MAFSPMVGALLPFAQAFTRGGKSTGISNLQDVKSTIGKYGVMRSCRGGIAFVPPQSIAWRSPPPQDIGNVIQTYCETFNVPSYGVATTEVRRYGSGPAVKYPVTPQQSDVTTSFIVDGAGVVAKFYNAWMNSIMINDHRLFTNRSDRPFDVAYKKFGSQQWYTTDVMLTVFDDSNTKSMSVVLYDAFPISIGEMQFNHGASNDLARMSVTFSYSYFSIIDKDMSGVVAATQSLPNDGIIGTAIKIGSAVQTLSTLKKPRSIGDVLNVTNNASIVAGAFRF